MSRAADQVRLDLTHAVRTLVRTPGFNLAALSLGLAVGGTIAVYGTADWLLNRSPDGVVAPEQLASLRLGERGREDVRYGFSFPQYERLREVQDAFSEVATYSKVVRFVSHGDWVKESVQQFVTGSYFPLLGVRPHLGRLITPDDDVSGAAARVVLAYDFWQSDFGGDPSVIGSTMGLGTDTGVIIGVLPPGFEDYSLDWNGPTQLWLPMRAAQTLEGMAGMLTMTQTFFPIVGRLRPGVSHSRAAEMAQRWVPMLPEITTPLFEPNAIRVGDRDEMRLSRRDRARTFLGALFVVCVLVLGAASANVVSFLLGRASLRRKEMALRVALGATRGRVFRQLLTETSLLAVFAAGLAALSVVWIGRLLAPLPQVYLGLSERTAPLTTFGAVDAKMLGTAVAVGCVAAVMLSALPMLLASREPMSALRAPPVGWSWSRLKPTPRQGVLVLQVGLAATLTVSATLFARTFVRAANIDVEYAEPDRLLIARLVPIGMADGEIGQFFEALLDQLSGDPGVVSVALGINPPFAGGRTTARLPTDDDGGRFEIGYATAGPGFFDTNGIEVVRGREFLEYSADRDQVVINRVLADRLWPGADPVGRTFVLGTADATVVGVVDRERCRELLGPPSPCAWSPVSLVGSGGRTVRVRTGGRATEFAPALRQTVTSLHPNIAIVQEQSLAHFLERSIRAEKVAAVASAALAVFGIVLLGVGCASVFVAMVRDSAREIAIRIALGVTNGRLVARVVGHGLLLMSAGLSMGLLATLFVAGRFAVHLGDVPPTDPFSYGLGASLILFVGMGAVTSSALAATRTDPVEHLHRD